MFDFAEGKLAPLLPVLLLRKPFGPVVDEQGRLYVVDQVLREVLVFSPEGALRRRLALPQSLVKPHSIALNARLHRFYVSDEDGHQVAVFDLSGRYLFSFGRMGEGAGELMSPHGLTVDLQRNNFV